MEDTRNNTIIPSIIKSFRDRIRTDSELVAIWDEIGYDVQYRDGFIDRFTQNVIKMFDHNVLIERKRRENLMEDIEKLGNEFLTLKSDLESSLAEPDESFSILQLKDYLEKQKAVLIKEKDERIRTYEILRLREDQASKKLGIPTKSLSFSLAPTLNQLETFKVYIKSLEAELANRKRILDDARPNIVALMNELDYTIHSDFQKEIVFSDNFFFSDGNMREIELLKTDLKQQLEKSKVEANKLRAKVVSLWNFLQINQDEQKLFLEKCNGHRRSSIELLNKEIDRCYKLKLANIEKYVKNIRLEIIKLWKMMFMEEIERCPYFKNENFTEDLLTIHEQELECLRKRYEDDKEIYTAFQNRLDLWERMKALESNACNPDRYTNRGGKLLMEEKERRGIMNQIPKLEKKILSVVAIWQQKKGYDFLVFGQPIGDFISNQWKMREQEKENEKLERKAKNFQSMEDILNGNKTALGSTKRPREAAGTPVRGGSKIARTNLTPLLTPLNSRSNTRIQMSSCAKPPLSSTKKLQISGPSKMKSRFQPARLFSKRGKPPSVSRQLVGTEDNPFSTSIESTNSEFKENLHLRLREDKHCRSSAIAFTPPSTPQGYRNRLGLPFLL